MLPTDPQPDQQPERWDDHVSVIESVFEPFTLHFARASIAALGPVTGRAVLDVGSLLRFDVAIVLILATVASCAAIDALSRGLRGALRIPTLATRLADAPR